MIVNKDVDQKGAVSVPNKERKEKNEQEKKFALFGNKSKLESIKKMGPAMASPIMADPKAVQDNSMAVLERYAVKEPVEHITIARDEVGSPIYLIEEPFLTEDEKAIYGHLIDTVQY